MALNLDGCSPTQHPLTGCSGGREPGKDTREEAGPECKLQAKVFDKAASEAETLPLFPAVYVKEEPADNATEGVCVKLEQFSDVSCKEDSIAAGVKCEAAPLFEAWEDEGLYPAGESPQTWGASLATSSGLDSHTRYKVTPEGSFQCSECEYIDKVKENLELHFISNHSCPEVCKPNEGQCNSQARGSTLQAYAHSKLFQCSQCEFFTHAKSHFKKHVIAKHSGVRPFECELCEYSTAYKNHLNRHILVKHSDVKPFQCLECEYSSAYKNHLKQHVLAKHSGVRPYQCSQCEYSSSYKNHLKQHTMIKHSGVKPFQCPECQFSTADKNHLKKHTTVKHSGTKRFQCSQCEHTSAYKGNLRIHFNAKHSGIQAS